jgi:hypothetical protein
VRQICCCPRSPRACGRGETNPEERPAFGAVFVLFCFQPDLLRLPLLLCGSSRAAFIPSSTCVLHYTQHYPRSFFYFLLLRLVALESKLFCFIMLRLILYLVNQKYLFFRFYIYSHCQARCVNKINFLFY